MLQRPEISDHAGSVPGLCKDSLRSDIDDLYFTISGRKKRKLKKYK